MRPRAGSGYAADSATLEAVELTSSFAQYVEHQMSGIEGWTGSTASVLMLEPIAEVQSQWCDSGGALEIGVHHARYLIALHLLCGPGSRSLGLDLFAEQSKNVDRSGSGDLQIARSAIDRFAREPDLVELRSGDSLALSDAEIAAIRDEFGAFRLISVDGGHTPEHIVADLRTADRLADPAALVLVDDFFHPGFPGVTEGYYELARTRSIPWVPLFLHRKKLVLCHVSLRPSYWAALTRDIRNEIDRYAKPKVVRIGAHDALFYAI